ncbi:hypothetical protein [Catenulispora subtropica]|uniref:Core-binding (CB) domain-containing protein n=1 Tax=Catenulispora subtropica TaxID=450798 RepID=A0ABN2R4Z5_9ACTN
MKSGSWATMPSFDHRRVPPLPPDSLVVRHVEESGRTARDYDFGELPVPEPLRRSLAELFASRVGPDGTWRQLISSREVWVYLTMFCRFLADQDEPVNDVEDISAAVWAAFRLSRPSNTSGGKQVVKIQALLRGHPRLPAETRELMAKRGVYQKAKETAYSPEEFDRIKTVVTRRFRTALFRIRENQQHLDRWRAGEFAADSDQWRLGAELDHIARTGRAATYVGKDGRMRVTTQAGRILGGTNAEATWKRLFLDSEEGAALIMLMIATYGWNSTTVQELEVPEPSPDAGADGQLIYRLELQKRRRHIPNRYETRNLADFGADSPGRLITQAIEATAPARSALAALGRPSNHLVLWHSAWMDEAMFRTGLPENVIEHMQEEMGLERPANARRLRKTVLIGKREPVLQSQDVHDSVYVVSDPRTAAEAAEVIEAGIGEAVQVAQTAFAAKVSRSDVPADMDTATACCTDYTASPFGGSGSPCRASFLLCTGCPNAVVTLRHLPRLAYLLSALSDLSSVLPSPVWEADWRGHHRRLLELRARPEFTDTEWSDALEQATGEDREIIDTLLNRGFDA